MFEAGLAEEALRRFTPAIIALTTETKDTVEVGPVLQHLARDVQVWKSIYVLDRIEVCQWFVQNMTDPSFSANVAEVKAQLPTPDSQLAPDANLSALCLKHRLIAIAVSRERERRAAIAAAEAEYTDLVAQLVEDGMNEADAAVEARRTLDENADEPEEDEGPPIRDIVLIKGFPHHIQEVLALDRVGLAVSAIVIINSAARFGRREDLAAELKDVKAAAKKRPDLRKPENKKGKGGRDDTDRVDPLTIQVAKELSRMDAFEPTPLRDILLWSYDVPCTEGASLDDGTRTYLAKESEAVTSDKVAQSFFNIVEKVFRYREWLSQRRFTRVPKLSVRETTEEVKVVLAVPTPTPTVSNKNNKKIKLKVEPDVQKEEVIVVPPPPELSDCVGDLTTNLELVDRLLADAPCGDGAAEMALYGSCLQAAALATAFGKGAEERTLPSAAALAESAAAVFIDSLLADLDGVADTVNRERERRVSINNSRVQVPTKGSADASASNAFVSLTHSTPLTALDAVGGGEAGAVIASLRQAAVSRLFGRDAVPLKEEIFTSMLEAVGVVLGDKDVRSARLLELLPHDRMCEVVASSASRSDTEGFVTASFESPAGYRLHAKRNAPAPNAGAKGRFRESWYLFQGRLPFPVWSGMEDSYNSERSHYYPPMQDDDEDVLAEEEEEEEDTFDEDGNLLPKKVKTFPIHFHNFAKTSSELIQRRAVFESLKQQLRCYASEVVQANNHGATSLSDAHTCLYPSDGSCISVRTMRGNAHQGACTVHDRSGECTFGFHVTFQPAFKKSTDKIKGGGQTQDSHVRGFFSTTGGVRLTIETSVYDPSPPVPAALVREAAADAVAVSTTAAVGSAPAVPPTAGAAKRSNTPRAKLLTTNNTPPSSVTPMTEDLLTPTSNPATALTQSQVGSVTTSAAFGASRLTRCDAPTSVVTAVINDAVTAQLRSGDTTLMVTHPYSFVSTVAGSSGLRAVKDSATSVVVTGDDRAILLVGKEARLKLFATGDIAAYHNGTWLLTAMGSGNRLRRSDAGAHAVPTVLMATTIVDGVTTITRDDGVEIISKPQVSVRLPGGIMLHKSPTADVSTFVLPCGTHIVFDGDSHRMEFKNETTLLRDGEGRVVLGSPSKQPRAVYDFSSYRLYVAPELNGPVHRIDCAYGGLRVHDDKDAYHVSPMLRCRQVPREVEEAPLPSDLTQKHVVDVFVEVPEVVAPPFEAYASLAGFPVAESLHAIALLPKVPQPIDALLQWQLLRVKSLPTSVYVAEKSATLSKKLQTVADLLPPRGKANPWPTNVFVLHGASGWATARDADVLSTLAEIRQGDPILSDVVRSPLNGQDAETLSLVRCRERGRMSRSSCDVREFCVCGPSATFLLPPPPLTQTLAGLVESIPKAILAQMDSALGSRVSEAHEVLASGRAVSATWPHPVTDLHDGLRALKAEEPRYWNTRSGRAAVLSNRQPAPKAPAKADKSPGGASRSAVPSVSPAAERTIPNASSKVLSQKTPPVAARQFANPQPPEVTRKAPKRVLVPTPASLVLGPVMERLRYSVPVHLTNVSTGVCRFRATCASPWVQLQYKMAPLAAGMTTLLEIEFSGAQPQGSLSTDVVIAHEGGSFTIPLQADCHPSSNKVIVPQHPALKILGPM